MSQQLIDRHRGAVRYLLRYFNSEDLNKMFYSEQSDLQKTFDGFSYVNPRKQIRLENIQASLHLVLNPNQVKILIEISELYQDNIIQINEVPEDYWSYSRVKDVRWGAYGAIIPKELYAIKDYYKNNQSLKGIGILGLWNDKRTLRSLVESSIKNYPLELTVPDLVNMIEYEAKMTLGLILK